MTILKPINLIRNHQASVTNEVLIETRDIISQEYICKKGLGIVAVDRYYPIIIKAIDELIDHRSVKVE